MPTPVEPSKVTYQTFVNDLNAGLITHADLYSYGRVDFTYTTKDGVVRSVGIPHKANENSLLTHALSAQSVEYIAHDTSYPDDSDDNSNMAMWTGSFLFLAPVLLIVVILYQARVISSLGKKLASLRTGQDTEGSAPSE